MFSRRGIYSADYTSGCSGAARTTGRLREGSCPIFQAFFGHASRCSGRNSCVHGTQMGAAEKRAHYLSGLQHRYAGAGREAAARLFAYSVRTGRCGEAFDLVVSMNGFHAFPDKQKVFGETWRVLKPGGTFIACFYIWGKSRRTDWLVKTFSQKRLVLPAVPDGGRTAGNFAEPVPGNRRSH